MDLLQQNMQLVPYGSAGFFPDKLKLTGFSPSGLEFWTASPCALIDRSTMEPLRCHQIAMDFSPAPAAENLRDTQSKRDFLKMYLHTLCGVWEGSPKTFLDNYFAVAVREIEANRGDLKVRTEGLDGLVAVEDFVFSAPLPLPRAHLHLAPRAAAPTVEAEDMALVDFAFWTGKRLIAVDLDSGATPTPKKRRLWARIEQYGIDTLKIAPASLADAASLANVLGDDFGRFWETDRMPRTPFRGPRIADPVRANDQMSASKM